MTKNKTKKKPQGTFSFETYILRSIEKLYAESIIDEQKKNKSQIIHELLMEGFKAKGINPEEYGSTT